MSVATYAHTREVVKALCERPGGEVGVYRRYRPKQGTIEVIVYHQKGPGPGGANGEREEKTIATYRVNHPDLDHFANLEPRTQAEGAEALRRRVPDLTPKDVARLVESLADRYFLGLATPAFSQSSDLHPGF